MNQHLIDGFDDSFPYQTWLGFRLLVIDGTTLTLPKIKEIIEHFGVWNGRHGDPCPTARASQMYDPLNRMTIKALIHPKSIGEREQAKQLLSGILPNSLILLDRGYPAFWLFKLILIQGAEFCARMPLIGKLCDNSLVPAKKKRLSN